MNKTFQCFLFLCLMTGCKDEKAADPGVQQQSSGTSSEEAKFKSAVNQYPDSVLLKENLIQYYRENGNYENALQEVNNALKKDSVSARLWNIKAILHSENEDTTEAIKAFEKSVNILAAPEDVISLATLYAETKNKKSLELADALILADKSKADKEALFIKGLYYSAINDKQKAISFFDQCIAVNYTFMYAYREKCLALYDLGKYVEALNVIHKAVLLQNGYEEGYYYEGQCLEKLNRPADAIESYQTALMYAPDYIEAKEALARLGVKS